MAKRKRALWPVPGSVEMAEALYQEATREVSSLVAECRRLKERLVANRDRRGRPLSARGRRRLVSRVESSIMRMSCMIYTEHEAFQLLRNQESNERLLAAWKAEQGRARRAA